MKNLKIKKRFGALVAALLVMSMVMPMPVLATKENKEANCGVCEANEVMPLAESSFIFTDLSNGSSRSSTITLSPYVGITKTFTANLTWMSDGNASGSVSVTLYRKSDYKNMGTISLNPSNGYNASMSLTLPTSGDYTVYVSNNSGATVNGMAYFK